MIRGKRLPGLTWQSLTWSYPVSKTDKRMKEYRLKNLDCAACAAKIEENLSSLNEVKFVNINFTSSTMTLDTGDIDKVKARIREIEPEVEVEDQHRAQVMISENELSENKREIIKAVAGLLLLLSGMLFEDKIHNTPFHIAEYAVFVVAYLIAGWNVIVSAAKNIIKGHVFNEHFLMSVATMGAFAIHEMPEAVAVMLFYMVGELFQDIAVGRSRKSIKSLLEIKPDYANLKSGSVIS